MGALLKIVIASEEEDQLIEALESIAGRVSIDNDMIVSFSKNYNQS